MKKSFGVLILLCFSTSCDLTPIDLKIASKKADIASQILGEKEYTCPGERFGALQCQISIGQSWCTMRCKPDGCILYLNRCVRKR